jgi:hypothetical protein
MITLHIFTNVEQTEYDTHSFEDALEALYAVNHNQEAEFPGVEQLLTPFGFRVYNEEGLCFHSNDGDSIGEVLTV